jgi:hypothetical protein
MSTCTCERQSYGGQEVAARLARLQRSGAISASQARLLLRGWYGLDDGWASQPWFRCIREHTRCEIDRLRAKSKA